MEESVLPKKDGIYNMGEELSRETLAAIPLAVSPELQPPGLSSPDSIPFHPPCTGAWGEWL